MVPDNKSGIEHRRGSIPLLYVTYGLDARRGDRMLIIHTYQVS